MGGHEQSTVASWDAIAFRRDLHAHPELAFNEHRTAARICDVLAAAGLTVESGIAGTGIIASLKSGSSNRRIALRADMDALPITEATGLPYQSTRTGIFHGCGHDGHVTMLLCTALQLGRTRRFDGTVHFIFQPAEEGRAGARAMVEDGLFERFPVDRIFALHNWPGLPLGVAHSRPGPIMAAADRFEATIRGRGGHAAEPHLASQVLTAASRLVLAFDAIPSRRIAPTSSAVLSVTKVAGGQAHNVLPAEATVLGTVRTFEPAVQDRIEEQMRAIVAGVELETETTIDLEYLRYYPATINDAASVELALAAAAKACRAAEVAPDPAYTSEDFAYMLAARPGAYLWLGQGGDGRTAPLHHPGYDFADDLIGYGVALHTALAEHCLSA